VPTLIIVEDEALIAISIEQMVTELGWTVLGIARDLPRANALLDATRPDLAILDIQLVGATSIPVAQRCLATGTAVLFTTGYLAADIPPECAGYPVLAKPFSLEQLRACLEQAFPVETLGQGAGE